MSAAEQIYEVLQKMEIPYEVVEHPPASTTEEADRYIEGKEGVRTKSLFLCNQKKTTYYLVIMDDQKRLDIKYLAELLGEKRLKFGSSEAIQEKMGLEPGIISPFGLLHDKAHEINVFFDEEMLVETCLTFHPNDNSKTIFFATEDMYKFMQNLNHDYKIIKL